MPRTEPSAQHHARRISSRLSLQFCSGCRLSPCAPRRPLSPPLRLVRLPALDPELISSGYFQRTGLRKATLFAHIALESCVPEYARGLMHEGLRAFMAPSPIAFHSCIQWSPRDSPLFVLQALARLCAAGPLFRPGLLPRQR